MQLVCSCWQRQAIPGRPPDRIPRIVLRLLFINFDESPHHFRLEAWDARPRLLPPSARLLAESPPPPLIPLQPPSPRVSHGLVVELSALPGGRAVAAARTTGSSSSRWSVAAEERPAKPEPLTGPGFFAGAFLIRCHVFFPRGVGEEESMPLRATAGPTRVLRAVSLPWLMEKALLIWLLGAPLLDFPLLLRPGPSFSKSSSSESSGSALLWSAGPLRPRWLLALRRLGRFSSFSTCPPLLPPFLCSSSAGGRLPLLPLLRPPFSPFLLGAHVD